MVRILGRSLGLVAGDAIARIFRGHDDSRGKEESSGSVMAGLQSVEVRLSEVEAGRHSDKRDVMDAC